MINQNNPNLGNSEFKTETFIIIVKVTREKKKEYVPNPILGAFGLPVLVEHDSIKEEIIDKRSLTEPILILPNGSKIDTFESFRIRKPTVIHTENMRRVLTP